MRVCYQYCPLLLNWLRKWAWASLINVNQGHNEAGALSFGFSPFHYLINFLQIRSLSELRIYLKLSDNAKLKSWAISTLIWTFLKLQSINNNYNRYGLPCWPQGLMDLTQCYSVTLQYLLIRDIVDHDTPSCSLLTWFFKRFFQHSPQ